MAIKKTLGRQRIEIKKLDKKSNKQVTFSKRRAGLFKKAGELSVLCGVEVAFIVFSPNDKVFCFAHPTVEAVLDRFASGSSSPLEPAETYVPVADFNREYNELLKVLEMEKKKLMDIQESVKNARNSGQFWWDENVEGMGMEDLKQYRAALMEFRRKVGERVQRMMVMRVGGDMLPPLPPSAMHIPGSLSGMESGVGDESGEGGGGGGGGVQELGFGYF